MINIVALTLLFILALPIIVIGIILALGGGSEE